MNSPSYFEIQANNTEKAIRFYGDVFGWSFERDVSLPIEYYRIETEGIMGWLLGRPAHTPPMEHGTNAFTCSMQVESFDATAKKIHENGGKVALPKFAVAGKCWQGYFLDTENNVFGIFEADENAK